MGTMDKTVPDLEPLFHLVDHHKGAHDDDANEDESKGVDMLKNANGWLGPASQSLC